MEQKENSSLSVFIIEFKTFQRYLKKKIWIGLVALVLGICLGFLLYTIQRPSYKAITTFILEEKSVGGSGLAGLASQFGVSLGNMGGGESIFAGDNILNILQSKKVVEDVLLTKVDDKESKTLADSYFEFSGLKEKLKNERLASDVNFATAKLPLNPIEDSVLNAIYDRIIKRNLFAEKATRQGTIYRVQVTAENSLFSKKLSELLVTEASKLYLDIRVGTAQKNINELQRRSDSLLLLLNNKSYIAAANQPLDVNPGVRTAVVPMEIASRDKTVLATLYAEVTKNLEASKMILSQETPVIQLLDKPQYLLDDNKHGLLFFVIISSLAAECIFLMTLYLIFILGRYSKQENATRMVVRHSEKKEVTV